MDTLDFLRWVLPTSGTIVVLGLPRDSRAWRHLVETQELQDGRRSRCSCGPIRCGRATEPLFTFAVNTYGDWFDGTPKVKKVIRKQGNVVAARALYDDYDVKPGKDNHYQSKKEALDDIVKLSRALKLTPTIVDSGGGYHGYYHFDEDIDEGRVGRTGSA